MGVGKKERKNPGTLARVPDSTESSPRSKSVRFRLEGEVDATVAGD